MVAIVFNFQSWRRTESIAPGVSSSVEANPITESRGATTRSERRVARGERRNTKLRKCEIFVDKLHTRGNILCQDSCSYHKLSSAGIKAPCREPWENKSFKRRNASWQPRRKPPRKRNTKRTMLVQKSPRPPARSTSREAFPFRFRQPWLQFWAGSGGEAEFAPRARSPPQ